VEVSMTNHHRDERSGRAWRRRAAAQVIAVLAAVVVSGAAVATVPGARAAQDGESNPALAEFQKRIQEYVALHKKVEDGIRRLPSEATPEQIDMVLNQLSSGITKVRASAKAGDIFQPAIQVWIRRTLERVFSAPDGRDLRASILDENPIGTAVRVNGPYPDAIPLSTMPPKVIGALPELPDELEYRFVGDRLILFDHHAHLIVDYVDGALPRV